MHNNRLEDWSETLARAPWRASTKRGLDDTSIYPSPPYGAVMITEIYSCRHGQSLNEGRLEISAEITTREQAVIDAKRRQRRDPALKNVAYYRVTANGDSKLFYCYSRSERLLETPPPVPPARPKGRTSRPGRGHTRISAMPARVGAQRRCPRA